MPGIATWPACQRSSHRRPAGTADAPQAIPDALLPIARNASNNVYLDVDEDAPLMSLGMTIDYLHGEIRAFHKLW
jgi:hypothetical protein